MGSRIIVFLQRHRRGAAGTFFALTAAVCLPVWFLSPSVLLRAGAATMLLAHACLAALLVWRGVVSAAKWALYYVFAVALVGASAELGLLDRSGTGLGEGLSRLFGIAVYVALTQVLHLPQRAAARVKRALRRAAPEEELGGRAPLPRTTYAQMVVQKAAGIYFSKPYSISACSDGVRRLRIFTFLALAALGVPALLLVAGGRLLSMVSGWWAGTAVLASVAVITCGAGVFLFGFLRGLLVWPAFAAGYAAARGLGRLFDWAWALSPALFAALAAFLLCVAAGLLWRLFKTLVVHFGATFWQFERADALCAADLPLEELAPIAGFERFVRFEAELPGGLPAQPEGAVASFLADFLFFARLHRLVFCGYRLDGHAGRLTLYLYAEGEDKARRALDVFLRRREQLQTQFESEDDPDWKHFYGEIYPGEEEYQRIHNRYVYEMMEDDGFDFTQAVPQVYYFYFERKEDARTFERQARRLGFDRARYVESEPGPPRFGGASLPAYAVYAQLTSRLGLARMDVNTGRAVALAHEYHGRFDDWEIGELDQQELFNV